VDRRGPRRFAWATAPANGSTNYRNDSSESKRMSPIHAVLVQVGENYRCGHCPRVIFVD
jgi:hypothetical protein